MDTGKRPLISVITPVYNGDKFLEKLILSIQAQWDDDIEHLIIDDGSTDNTQLILKKYPHIRWWSRENRGQYATMNEGMIKASGQYICFISADDLITPNALKNIKTALRENQYPNAIYGKTQFMDENEIPYPVQSLVTHGGVWAHKYFNFIYHCSLYVKRDMLIANHLEFDANLNYAGDYDWIIRLFNNGLNPVQVDQYFSRVRIHNNQASVRLEKSAINEQKLVHRRYHINTLLLSLINFGLTIRSVILRLVWEMRYKGFKSFFNLFFYFAKHKTDNLISIFKKS